MAFSSIRKFFTRPNPALFPEEFAEDAREKAAQSQAFIAFLLSFREWVVGLGTAVTLTVFFRVAATATHNPLIYVLLVLSSCAVGLYIGMPIGKLGGSAYFIGEKWLRGSLVLLWFVAFYAMALTNVVGEQLANIVNQIAKTGQH